MVLFKYSYFGGPNSEIINKGKMYRVGHNTAVIDMTMKANKLIINVLL